MGRGTQKGQPPCSTSQQHSTPSASASAKGPEQNSEGDPELGSVTIENVLWAVASIAFAGIVVAVIKTYVTSKAGEIK